MHVTINFQNEILNVPLRHAEPLHCHHLREQTGPLFQPLEGLYLGEGGGWEVVVGRWWLGGGGWEVVVGRWWLGSGGWEVVVGRWWLGGGGWEVVVGRWWLGGGGKEVVVRRGLMWLNLPWLVVGK